MKIKFNLNDFAVTYPGDAQNLFMSYIKIGDRRIFKKRFDIRKLSSNLLGFDIKSDFIINYLCVKQIDFETCTENKLQKIINGIRLFPDYKSSSGIDDLILKTKQYLSDFQFKILRNVLLRIHFNHWTLNRYEIYKYGELEKTNIRSVRSCFIEDSGHLFLKIRMNKKYHRSLDAYIDFVINLTTGDFKVNNNNFDNYKENRKIIKNCIKIVDFLKNDNPNNDINSNKKMRNNMVNSLFNTLNFYGFFIFNNNLYFVDAINGDIRKEFVNLFQYDENTNIMTMLT